MKLVWIYNVFIQFLSNSDSKQFCEFQEFFFHFFFVFVLVLGGYGDSKHFIRKNGDVVTRVKEFNVLNEFKPIKVIVELTETGELRVFTDANKSRPLLEFNDNKPIDNLNIVSFAGYYRDLDFYYGCTA